MSQVGKSVLGSGGAVVETLTGNTGGPVGPDGAFNINVVGDTTTINVAGNAGTNTLTISAAGGLATTYTEDVGSASPALNNLNIFGGTSSGGVATNMNTIGSGSTVQVCLNNSISQPDTNASGTTGMYSLGGETFLHNYGTFNVFVGRDTGNLTLAGANNNTAIGALSASALTSGTDNVMGGKFSGRALEDGTFNTMIGSGAGASLVSGSVNLLLGSAAGSSYTASETANIMIGNNGVAGEDLTIRIGTLQTTNYQAGIYGVTPAVPTPLGVVIDSAGQLGTGGGIVATQYNEDSGSAVPSGGILQIKGGTSTSGVATNINTRGSGNLVEVNLNNSIFQPNTNASQTEGMYGLGGATFLHNFGTENTFCGANAGNLTLPGTNNGNTGIGYEALNSLSGGSADLNTAVGSYALSSVTTGSINCAIGGDSGMSLTVGTKNCLLGASTLKNATDATDNIAIGNAAMLTVSALCQYNIAMGTNSMSSFNNTSTGNIMLGFGSAANVDFAGNYNVGIGYGVAATIVGDDNIAIGRLAMVSSAVGATTTNNIAIGYQTMGYLGTGLNADYSIGIGYRSLYVAATADYNTAVGYQTLLACTTGDYNLALGYNAGSTGPTTQSSNIYLMHVGAAEANTIRIGTEGTGSGQQNTCYIAGITNTTLASPTGYVQVDANGQLGEGAAAGIFKWNSVAGTSQSAAVGNGYICLNAGLTTVTLPGTFAVGDVIAVVGTGAAFFNITATAGDTIKYVTSTTSSGGSLTATEQYDSIEVIGVVANTTWVVRSATGNYSVA